MLNKRQKEILKIIVEEHVRTAEPVGSKSIWIDVTLSVSFLFIKSSLILVNTFVKPAWSKYLFKAS